LVVRHTRLEEQTGRAELVRANVTGRHAALTAALLVAVITNAAATVVIGALMTAHGYTAAGSWLFACAVALVGLAFAGISAITVQLSEFSRGDRKSTRLNSSHVSISYAVFCLKKK